MKVVYKYIVDSQSMHQPIFAVTLPLGAEVLTVQKQGEQTCMWVLQDFQDNGPFQERRFVKIGTGQPVADTYKYVGTVQELDGALIWHYFEIL